MGPRAYRVQLDPVPKPKMRWPDLSLVGPPELESVGYVIATIVAFWIGSIVVGLLS